MRWLNTVARRWLAATVVTVVTLLLVGGAVVGTTNIGCSPANKIGLKLARCSNVSTTATRQSPTPFYIPPPSPITNPVPFTPPVSAPATYYPVNPPATGYPPFLPPGSSGRSPQYPFYPAATGMSGFPTLSCTLPVYVGAPGSGGFLSFPSGNFTADPRSAVAVPSPGPVPGPGYGYNPSGMAYDRAHSRWLPVYQQLVAPDGNHYAYGSSDGIYVVDPTSNTQVELGQGHPWQVLRTLNDRVYATIPSTAGFWVVPFSGSPVEVTTAGYWSGASASAAYGTPTSAVPQGATQQMQKLDIATGKITDWLALNGASLSVQGFDASGNPIVQAYYSGGWELWLASGPSSSYIIGNSYQGFNLQGAPFADTHGIWLPIYNQWANSPAVALFVPGQGLYVIQGTGVQIAGGCA